MKAQLIKRLLTLALSCLAAAPVAADTAISNLDPISINAWAGATNDLTGSDSFCIISCNGGCSDTNQRREYIVTASTNGQTDGSGNFYISSGSDDMLVYMDWTHPTGGTTRLTDGDYSPRVDGAYDCAADPNAQVQLEMTLPASELATASAGTYSETFTLDACRLFWGFIPWCVADVTFTVTLPELVQITRLDNINLGTWDGVNDIQVTEQFCVFRNGSGGFAIVTSGQNASGGNFNLAGASTVPYTLEYAQSGGYFDADPATILPSSTTGFTGSSTRNCGGANNTSLRVTVDAADLAGQPQGTFSDTIFLRVEPD
ncbi:MAG: hypothetical protein U5O39_09600 [Gammaproteobacteria bacterium]|nr:hypothetical protein [Gammaproteobacteria bacterium]